MSLKTNSCNSQDYKRKNFALFSSCFNLKDILSFASKTQNNNQKSCEIIVRKKSLIDVFLIKIPLQEKNLNHLIH